MVLSFMYIRVFNQRTGELLYESRKSWDIDNKKHVEDLYRVLDAYLRRVKLKKFRDSLCLQIFDDESAVQQDLFEKSEIPF